jgi:predicted metal-dependent phosphoesterase TrpH
MSKFDLHAHTTASDGLFTPTQLVEHAKKVGLQGVALTDHDIVSGFEEALEAGKKWGIEVIPGVEISTLWEKKEIHVLGYFIDTHSPKLLEQLQIQRQARQRRNQQMIQKLNELGIEIRIEEVLAKKRDDVSNVGRPHIAEVLVDKGVVQTISEAFDKYLGEETGIAYVTTSRIDSLQAIDLIKECGGVPVLAHPGLYGRDELIPLMVERGLVGLEVRHPDHSAEDVKRYQRLAEKYGLIPTAGSDFHGERQGAMYHADLGTCSVDVTQVEKLRAKAKHRLK